MNVIAARNIINISFYDSIIIILGLFSFPKPSKTMKEKIRKDVLFDYLNVVGMQFMLNLMGMQDLGVLCR